MPTIHPIRRQRRSLLASGALALLACLLISIPHAHAAVPLDPAGFTQRVAAALNAEPLPEQATIAGPLTLRARTSQGVAEISLDNVYHLCSSDTDRCEAGIRQFVLAISTRLRDAPAPITPAKLRIVIKTETFAHNLPTIGGSTMPATRQNLPKGLVALIYADSPTSLQGMTVANLQDLHLSVEQAFSIATSNTAKELQPLDKVLKPVPPGQVGAYRGDDYESSRLFMHEQWAGLAKQFGGHLLVAVPSAEELVYANGSTPDGLARLISLARIRFEKADRAVSPQVFEWRPEGWVAATP